MEGVQHSTFVDFSCLEKAGKNLFDRPRAVEITRIALDAIGYHLDQTAPPPDDSYHLTFADRTNAYCVHFGQYDPVKGTRATIRQVSRERPLVTFNAVYLGQNVVMRGEMWHEERTRNVGVALRKSSPSIAKMKPTLATPYINNRNAMHSVAYNGNALIISVPDHGYSATNP